MPAGRECLRNSCGTWAAWPAPRRPLTSTAATTFTLALVNWAQPTTLEGPRPPVLRYHPVTSCPKCLCMCLLYLLNCFLSCIRLKWTVILPDVRPAKILRSGWGHYEKVLYIVGIRPECREKCRARKSKEKDSDFGNDAVKFIYSVPYLLGSDRI